MDVTDAPKSTSLTIGNMTYMPALDVAKTKYRNQLNDTVKEALKNCWVCNASKSSLSSEEIIVRIKPSKEYLETGKSTEKAQLWNSSHKVTVDTRPGRFDIKKKCRSWVVQHAVDKYKHDPEQLRIRQIDLSLRQFIGLLKPLEKMSEGTCHLEQYESPVPSRKNKKFLSLKSSPSAEAWIGKSSNGTPFALLVEIPKKGGRIAFDLMAMKGVWISEDPPLIGHSSSTDTIPGAKKKRKLKDSKERDQEVLKYLHTRLKGTKYNRLFEAVARYSVRIQGSPTAEVKVKQKGSMLEWKIEQGELHRVNEKGQIKVLRTIAHMLSGLSRADVIHGDIKIDNMLRTSNPDSITEIPNFTLADFGGSFCPKDYPFDSIEDGTCLSTFSPDRMHMDDCSKIRNLIDIRDEKDDTQFIHRVVDLFADEVLIEQLNELTLDCISPKKKSALSDIIMAGRTLKSETIFNDKNRLESTAPDILQLNKKIHQYRKLAMPLLKQRAIEIHRKRDVFAAGIELFALFTGHLPLAKTMLVAVQMANTPPKKKISPKQEQTLNRKQLQLAGIAAPIADLIISMLHPDYTRRPDSFAVERKYEVIRKVFED